MVYYVEMTIKELRAFIQWRKQACNKQYRDWNQLCEADRKKYEQFQQEIRDAVKEIDRRKSCAGKASDRKNFE